MASRGPYHPYPPPLPPLPHTHTHTHTPPPTHTAGRALLQQGAGEEAAGAARHEAHQDHAGRAGE
jgi:hypothetical protein